MSCWSENRPDTDIIFALLAAAGRFFADWMVEAKSEMFVPTEVDFWIFEKRAHARLRKEGRKEGKKGDNRGKKAHPPLR